MQLGYFMLLGLMSAVVASCGEARAEELDASNPLHCALQFESYHILAKQMGKFNEARGYGARAHWYAVRARSLPSKQRTDEAVAKLADQLVAAPDGGLALAVECSKRQDADPDFKQLVARARSAKGM